MSDILLPAIFTAFTMVRVLKGPWLRNPQYLASGILGAIVGALLLHAFWPAYDDDVIVVGGPECVQQERSDDRAENSGGQILRIAQPWA
ncbi:hypothetical protein, partial [Mesorhizobium sp. M1A.F.Ca.IN.020.03.1.1]|uniref:hypothetical protein n=1 Tax=Mesorhizobium sp. M1A.F.Ca.IN.020.03.1.1 TaxID=2496764 RepID=UPI001FE102A0